MNVFKVETHENESVENILERKSKLRLKNIDYKKYFN